MAGPGTPVGTKVFLLAAGTLAVGGMVGLLATILAIALSSGRGAGAAGSVMMAALLLLAVLYLGLLVPLMVLLRRWTGKTGLALVLAFGIGVLLAVLWLLVAFVLAVILNR